MAKIIQSTINNPSVFISPQMIKDIDAINNQNRRFPWIRQPLWRHTKNYSDNLRTPTFLSPRDKTNRRKLIEALVSNKSTQTLQIIGYKMLTCCPSNSCRSPLCNYCRTKLQNRYEDRVLRYFANSEPKDIYYLTVLDDVTYQPLAEMTTRRDDLMQRLRRRLQHPKYNKNILAFGALEIDVKNPLQSIEDEEQAEMMSSYGLLDTDDYAFMPHLHIIVDLKGMKLGDFRKHLTDKFTKKKQITLSPHRDHDDKEFHLKRMARYSFKFRYQHSDNILRARSAFGSRFDDDLLRIYTELVHDLSGQNGVISYEFRHNLLN